MCAHEAPQANAAAGAVHAEARAADGLERPPPGDSAAGSLVLDMRELERRSVDWSLWSLDEAG
jgi:hypothetical protein